MKKANKINFTALVALIALTNYMCGCSVVGLGIGAAIDAENPDYYTVEGDSVNSIKPYSRTIVHTNDGSLKIGKFAGLSTMPLNDTLSCNTDSIIHSVQKTLYLHYRGISDSLPQPSEYINLDNVTSIEVKNPKHAKWVGLAIGLGIDMVVLMVAISNMKFDYNLEGDMN